MKILILTAATGGGHLRASSALKSYILETQDDCEVEIVDTLKYISPLLDKTVTEGYEAMAKRTPKLFGSLYKSTNRGKSKTTYFFCNIFRAAAVLLVKPPEMVSCSANGRAKNFLKYIKIPPSCFLNYLLVRYSRINTKKTDFRIIFNRHNSSKFRVICSNMVASKS